METPLLVAEASSRLGHRRRAKLLMAAASRMRPKRGPASLSTAIRSASFADEETSCLHDFVEETSDWWYGLFLSWKGKAWGIICLALLIEGMIWPDPALLEFYRSPALVRLILALVACVIIGVFCRLLGVKQFFIKLEMEESLRGRIFEFHQELAKTQKSTWTHSGSWERRAYPVRLLNLVGWLIVTGGAFCAWNGAARTTILLAVACAVYLSPIASARGLGFNMMQRFSYLMIQQLINDVRQFDGSGDQSDFWLNIADEYVAMDRDLDHLWAAAVPCVVPDLAWKFILGVTFIVVCLMPVPIEIHVVCLGAVVYLSTKVVLFLSRCASLTSLITSSSKAKESLHSEIYLMRLKQMTDRQRQQHLELPQLMSISPAAVHIVVTVDYAFFLKIVASALASTATLTTKTLVSFVMENAQATKARG